MLETPGPALLDEPTILVVDDVPTHLAVISEMLSGRFRCRVATRGAKALELAEACPGPDLILLDVGLPDMDGYEVCRRLKKNLKTRGIPIIFLTSFGQREDESRGLAEGGADYLVKPVGKSVLTARIEAQLSLLRSRRLLEAGSSGRKKPASGSRSPTRDGLAGAVRKNSPDYDADRPRRISLYTRELARALRARTGHIRQLDDGAVEIMCRASLLHDIGKTAIPVSLLSKQGKLSPAEFEIVKRHALLGGTAVLELDRKNSLSEEFVAMALDIAMHHHERWDGTGYPLGLKGEDIPLCARIVALADTYDALTGKRVYKPPFQAGEAAAIVRRGRGRQFDPAIVDAFDLCERSFSAIADGAYTNGRVIEA